MSLVIPTIFTAVNKFSTPVGGMANDVSKAANKMQASFAKIDASVNKTFSIFSEGQKQLLSNFSAVAIATGITGAIGASVKALMDYETELANLKAVTGVSGKAFDVFKVNINDVALATKESAVTVTKAFTAIANNQPELLKDAEALAMVTKSSIMLAQASKMELGPAGEALTQILNQFGKGAKEAAATVDILSAGSVAGSSEIRDTAAAIQEFGTVAANAGIKINESVALIELASKFNKGAEAGTKLRNILLVMSTAKVQDPKAIADMHRLGINMNIVQNAALPLNVRLQEMSKAAKDNAALFHIFGKENQALATGVLANAKNFTTMLDAVNTTGMTAKMAADNNDTLETSIKFLGNAWVNMLTGSTKASTSLNAINNIVKFITNHIDTLAGIIFIAVGAFIAWKAIMIAVTTYTWLCNAALFVMNFELAESETVALAASVAIGAITAAQWLWNTSMTVGAVALAALSSPLLLIAAGVLIVVSVLASFYRNWEMIKKSFSDGGILSGIKAIGVAILDSVLAPLQYVLSLIAKITGADWAKSASTGIEKFRTDIGVDVNGNGETSVTPAINSKKTEQNALIVSRSESTQRQNVSIDINDSTGRANVTSSNDMVPITTTRTLGGGLSNKL